MPRILWPLFSGHGVVTIPKAGLTPDLLTPARPDSVAEASNQSQKKFPAVDYVALFQPGLQSCVSESLRVHA